MWESYIKPIWGIYILHNSEGGFPGASVLIFALTPFFDLSFESSGLNRKFIHKKFVF